MKTKLYHGVTLRNQTGRRAGWFLASRGRVRWGTLAEIKRDAEHLRATGKVPERRLGWA